LGSGVWGKEREVVGKEIGEEVGPQGPSEEVPPKTQGPQEKVAIAMNVRLEYCAM
jgi:hypothetical protein